MNNPNDSIKSAMKARIIGLIRKPTVEVKKKKPANMAPLALAGFDFTMAFLDLISAVAVGALTQPLYGVLTFIAGFAALMIWQKLFTNAHANMTQKWIAVGGGVIAVLSTLGLGILSAIANVMDLAGTFSIAALEITMIVSLVVIAFIHGIAWGIYYFTDPNHIAEMKRLVNMAYREQQLQGLEDAKDDLRQVLDMDKELQGYEERGELELLDASYQTMRGRSLINAPEPTEEAIPAPAMFKKQSTTEGPAASGTDFREE